ncbi:MAG: serine/threonine protein kinase [Myxococcota bacterium]
MPALRADRWVSGRYRLVRPLGSGGQATAWMAHDHRSGRPTVLKMLHARGECSKTRFEREATVLRYLQHPHIVTARGLVEDQGYVFLRVDLVEGPSLRDVVLERAVGRGPFEPTHLTSFVQQVASALDYCHGVGVIHRDLKPANIMVGDGALRHVTILDFGVAKLRDVDVGSATTAGRMLGTLVYSSPEQSRGIPVQPVSDLFSLATILYELITLRRPWLRDDDGRPLAIGATERDAANSRFAVGRRIMDGEWIRLALFRPDLATLDTFFEAAFHPDPQRRFATAANFAEAWGLAVEGKGATTEGPRTDPAAPWGPLPLAPISASDLIEGDVPVPPEETPTTLAPNPRNATPSIEKEETGADEAKTQAALPMPRPRELNGEARARPISGPRPVQVRETRARFRPAHSAMNAPLPNAQPPTSRGRKPATSVLDQSGTTRTLTGAAAGLMLFTLFWAAFQLWAGKGRKIDGDEPKAYPQSAPVGAYPAGATPSTNRTGLSHLDAPADRGWRSTAAGPRAYPVVPARPMAYPWLDSERSATERPEPRSVTPEGTGERLHAHP